MSWTSRVVWREGMFLRPQHFQQQDRYLHHLLESRVSALQPYAWGVHEIEVDRALLGEGIIQLTRCSGIFDDGTPFEFPQGDIPGPSLQVSGDAGGMIVYLALLRARPGVPEITPNAAGRSAPTRQRSTEWSVADSNVDSREPVPLEVSQLHLRLVLERDRLSDDSSIGLMRIAQVDDSGAVSLDSRYIPPCLDCALQSGLAQVAKEIASQLRIRAEYLVARVIEGERGGVGEVAKYMLLQLVNAYKPLFEHWSQQRGLHPIALYEVLLRLAGELSTFCPEGRMAPKFPAYRHDQLEETLRPVVDVIRRELNRVPEEAANEIVLQSDRFGFHVAKLGANDVDPAVTFVLAAKAEMPSESLRRDFPPQVTVGAPQQIAQLVKGHLPGVGLFPLQAAPAQIPIHAGFTYFQLDQASAQWKLVAEAKGLAFHVPETFPGLVLTLWAIKG
jgi:type VI secretion system protein ImpJ